MDGDFDALKREATAWVVRLTSGKATTEDGEALRLWRARSEEHERAFREAARLWRDLGPALAEKRVRAPLMGRRSFLTGSAMAAGAAGAAFIMSDLGFLPSINGLLADHKTAVGEQKSIALSDGSTVVLDGGSALVTDYTADARHLSLTAGAAVFEVEGADPRPFVVSAAEGRATLPSGTISVGHAVNDVSVACIQGTVQVDCLTSVTLVQGEGVVYSAAGLGEKIVSEAETVAAWRKGLLVFNDRRLGDVVADLNRHRRGKVMLASNALASQRVSGVFHLDRPEEILAHFQDALQIRSMNLVGGIVLLM
ncbi:FecR family protein [Nitratireductor pacificus]|uniref:Transmembrane sensor n=1 Tax=Nitratireductor pacificus pht-3B TaxID=391937 RepID=K2MED4_9HYPH|nr:FecR family protein [Nitratireductor pacificus]EKF20531.1 transmembrane sensor [Nitratireductor pacificus pht-3B]